MGKRWFGDTRSVAEQLRGLEAALAAAPGRSVLDFGCAEGAIAVEFARAGAAQVYACDCNHESIRRADEVRAELPADLQARLRFAREDVNDRQNTVPERSGIVLALAILHKMRDPEGMARYMAAATAELLVIRLPGGSTGAFASKWDARKTCDTMAVLPQCGLKHEARVQGPRNEFVDYWRRTV